MSNQRTWTQWLSGSPAPPSDELPTTVSPSPTITNLQEVVVIPNKTPTNGTVGVSATAPKLPLSTIGANALKLGVPPPTRLGNPRRGEYVALGGSRKGGKGHKGKKSKKSRKSKSKKASKSRK